MEQKDLIKYLLIGVGAYLIWQYVIEPMMAQQPAQQPVNPLGATQGALPTQQPVAAPVATGTTTGASTPSSPAATAAQLQHLAGSVMMTPDQWAYYYHTLPGKANLITGSQMESILANLSLTDATRATNVTAPQFIAALQSVGLSGINPAWQSGGGPAFSSFIPGGFQGSGGFSGYNRGFKAAPKAYLQ